MLNRFFNCLVLLSKERSFGIVFVFEFCNFVDNWENEVLMFLCVWFMWRKDKWI